MDHLLAWRKEFPILEKTTYLISHSLGAMPRRTADALQEFAGAWAERGIRAWEEGWWEMPITIGNLVGSIIGARPGEEVMHQNVSICQSIVTSCFDWNGRRFGATGIVGDGLLRWLIASPEVSRVVAVPRKPLACSIPSWKPRSSRTCSTCSMSVSFGTSMPAFSASAPARSRTRSTRADSPKAQLAAACPATLFSSAVFTAFFLLPAIANCSMAVANRSVDVTHLPKVF